jgi:hypothetical protein
MNLKGVFMFQKLFISAAGALLAFSASAFDETYVVSVNEFEDLQISKNGVTVNNFSIAEKNAFLVEDAVNVEVSFSVRNKNDQPKGINVMLVGMSDDKILWALEAAPGMSMISGKKTDDAVANSYVSPGTVKQTNKIWMRVVGDF